MTTVKLVKYEESNEVEQFMTISERQGGEFINFWLALATNQNWPEPGIK